MTSLAFWQGVEEFNHHEFYACHDTLEAIWMESIDPDKKFYQGVLQIAVGCYHLSHQNWQGSVTLLGEGIHRLSSYQPTYHDIDVTKLVEESYQLLLKLQGISSEQIGDFLARQESKPNQGFPKIIPVLVEDREQN
ncbi:MAG: DUF309 domain-containing protein [Microcystaceae cyanobacterium]